MVRSRINLIWAAYGLLLAASLVDGVGVNWGTQSSDVLNPSIIVNLLQDNKINKIKLFDSDHWTVAHFAGTGIEVMPGIPNNRLKEFSEDYDYAKDYVKNNISDHLRKGGVDIKYIAVGNEPFLHSYKGANLKTIFPALKNVQKALNEAGLDDKIKATIPQNADVYASASGTPSDGNFRSDIRDLMVQIVRFLKDNDAPFIVNIYPFLSLYENPDFPIDYAFFDGHHKPVDDNEIHYDNMFDANLDTLVWSLRMAGAPNLKIIVGEIGWPTDGHKDATVTMAKRFYDGFFKKMSANEGTPLYKEPIEYYLFGLVDENQKSIAPGNFERHWGIFRYDGKPKFSLDFSGKGTDKWPVAARNVQYMPKQWCVLNDDSKKFDGKVFDNLGYACSLSDCTSLGYGSSCNKLDLAGNVSYAFNMYFQMNQQDVEACDFQGLAKITTQNMSTSQCLFPIALESDGIKLKIHTALSILVAFLILLALI